MPVQSYEMTTRQLTRAKEIAQKAMDSGEWVALKILAPDMVAAADNYLIADRKVHNQQQLLTKEVQEADTGTSKLSSLYNQLLPVAQQKLGFDGGYSSTYRTADDLFASAELMEASFEKHKEQQWASEALAALTPMLDSSSKEYHDQVQAYRDIQKAQAQRARAADQSRHTLLLFRRVVRASLGKQSREYHDLQDQRRQTTPAPTSPQ